MTHHDELRADDDGMTVKERLDRIAEDMQAVYGHKNRFTRKDDERAEFGFAVGEKARVQNRNQPRYNQTGRVHSLRVQEQTDGSRDKVVGVAFGNEIIFFMPHELENVALANERVAEAVRGEDEGQEPTQDDLDAVDTIDAIVDPAGYAEALRRSPAMQAINERHRAIGAHVVDMLLRKERLPLMVDSEHGLIQCGEPVDFAVLSPLDVHFLNDVEAQRSEDYADAREALSEYHTRERNGIIEEAVYRALVQTFVPMMLEDHNRNLLTDSRLAVDDTASINLIGNDIYEFFDALRQRTYAEIMRGITSRNGALRDFLSQEIRETM